MFSCTSDIYALYKSFSYIIVSFFCLTSFGTVNAAIALDQVGKYQVYEIELVADKYIENPFDVYLLKIELESPDGRKIILDGFFDGNGAGAQDGRVWKVRICPNEVGVWNWRTIPGDQRDLGLLGFTGSFECVESYDPGGIIQDGKFFRFQENGYLFLQGNFLDFVDGLPSTHVFMSEMITDTVRSKIITRQHNYHNANKINVYFANKGDYGGISTTPWVKTEFGYDLSRMDIAAWVRFDQYIIDIKNAGMLAELYFFSDDSGFRKFSQADKNRLFRYGMARSSAFNHTLFVIALEWQEEWSLYSLRTSGRFIQNHNPWHRLLSAHSLPAMASDSIMSFFYILYKKIFSDIRYSREPWISFIVSQAGNDAIPKQVNSLAVHIRSDETIPHISEEFGVLKKDGDLRLMRNMWANFCGGSAGGGTGDYIDNFMRFLKISSIPFHRMEPMNALIENGRETTFCLAEIGHHYLVFSQKCAFKLNVEGEDLTGYWYNPTVLKAGLQNPIAVQPGIRWFQSPESFSDCVLWVTDGSNLNNIRLSANETNSMEAIKRRLVK
jgi:hypothetical protein